MLTSGNVLDASIEYFMKRERRMHKHSRQFGFDSLEGRQLLSVTATTPALVSPPPTTRVALLADIKLDLGTLAKQQVDLVKDKADVTADQVRTDCHPDRPCEAAD